MSPLLHEPGGMHLDEKSYYPRRFSVSDVIKKLLSSGRGSPSPIVLNIQPIVFKSWDSGDISKQQKTTATTPDNAPYNLRQLIINESGCEALVCSLLQNNLIEKKILFAHIPTRPCQIRGWSSCALVKLQKGDQNSWVGIWGIVDTKLNKANIVCIWNRTPDWIEFGTNYRCVERRKW